MYHEMLRYEGEIFLLFSLRNNLELFLIGK
ncbi:hypothetical protein U722_17840 [Bacillus amyloliquefaciens LFB112]|nr:hypothetical protein U722_17840 [Bacillus amyloliquefaciens LFB112]